MDKRTTNIKSASMPPAAPEVQELLQASRNMLTGIGELSRQMGIVDGRRGDLENRFGAIEKRMDQYEDTARVDRPQAMSIKRAIHARVREVLGIRYTSDGTVADECLADDVKYRSGFIQRLYHDARNYSKLGNPYYDTAVKDYGEVLDYIHGWLPVAGVKGYKDYLDKRAQVSA